MDTLYKKDMICSKYSSHESRFLISTPKIFKNYTRSEWGAEYRSKDIKRVSMYEQYGFSLKDPRTYLLHYNQFPLYVVWKYQWPSH